MIDTCIHTAVYELVCLLLLCEFHLCALLHRFSSPSQTSSLTHIQCQPPAESRSLSMAQTWQSHATVAGHPLHPLLIPLPFGSLTLAVTAATLGYLRPNLASKYNLADVYKFSLKFGVATGVVASIPGIVDTLYLPANTRAKRVALVHGAGNLLALALFYRASKFQAVRQAIDRASVSAAHTASSPSTGIPRNSFLLSAAGFGITGVTGFLGGELVERMGVSVDPRANLNAKLSTIYGTESDSHDYISLNLGVLTSTDHSLRDYAYNTMEPYQGDGEVTKQKNIKVRPSK